MRKFQIFLLVILCQLPNLLHANLLGASPLMPIKVDVSDTSKLQRGAKVFMNYCSGCHSLRYMRYNRMAKDLGLTNFDGSIDNNLLMNNLIFTHATIYDPIEIAMPAVDARQWFGISPPDLSLITRKRGASWVYTFLLSFYEDKTRPFGSNNAIFPNVAMPNVLAPLSGRIVQKKLISLGQGEMTQREFQSLVEDLVTFLAYVGEPEKLVRHRIGWFFIAYLGLFLWVAWRLKKNYWKDVC